MKKKNVTKRGKLICAILLLIAALIGLLAVLLSQLDIDNYRAELEEKLADALHQPVAIGRIQLTYDSGLALAVNDLRLGTQETPLAQLPRLTATLKLKELLEGRLILDQVQLDGPALQLWLPLPERPPQGTTHQIFDSLGIRILTIRDASLTVLRRSADRPQQPLRLTNLNLVLRGWQSDSSGQLTCSARLQQDKSPAELFLNLSLPASPSLAEWRQNRLNGELKIDNFSLAGFGSKRLPGAVDISATLQGTPQEGAELIAQVAGSHSKTELLAWHGRWQSSAELEQLGDLSGTLAGLPLSGELSLARKPEELSLNGSFSLSDQPLTPELLKRLRLPGADKLISGALERLSLSLTQHWPVNEKPHGLPRLDVQLAAGDLQWKTAGLRQLQDISVDLTLEGQLLSLHDGVAVVADGQPVSFNGQLSSVFNKPQLDLNLHCTLPLERLAKQLTLPASWSLTGPVSGSLHLGGELHTPTLQLQADLSQSNLQAAKLLQKPPNQPATLQATGQLEAEQLQIDRLQLTLGAFELVGAGTLARGKEASAFRFNIDPLELSDLVPYSPLLHKLKAHGRLSPAIERDQDGLHGHLSLDEVGAHLFNIVGDLNQASGEIDFNRQGLAFQQLTTKLGESPLTVSGQLNSWQDPTLSLDITGNKVRAVDLIFPNRSLTLYDLTAHLQIDSRGIDFAPAHVFLEKATEATVTGTLEDFGNPQVKLNIRSEKADILDVIKLFHGPRKRKKVARKNPKPLLIEVQAAQGSLGGLKFQNATGSIRDYQGVFTIYPLHFQNGDGYCLARVEFDRNQPDGLLKVSGHAEDVDASSLHQGIFKERGLVSGKLRGDFYLEGSLKDNHFWHNARGGIHLQIKDGTLRKFRGLARVFSVLNVSQIFAGKLPDMDKDGMPFTLAEATAKVGNGRLRTDDLHVESVAMNLSLVGEQNLIEDTVDYELGVMPLRTVDKLVSNIPIAGWILTGEDKALLTAYFKVEGPSKAPQVSVVPVSTASKSLLGIIKRTLGLPAKLIEDIDTLMNQQPAEQTPPAPEPQN